MTTTALAEWLLARLADRDRAAAIMGDLEELAQTRGRRWFWIAYARTLIALAWRPSAAFLVGYVSFLAASLALQGPWVGVWAQPPSRMMVEFQHGVAPLIPFVIARLVFPIAGPLLASIAIPLRFVFPYAAVRYGLRDPFTQLAGAVFVATNLVLIYPPLLSPLFAIAAVIGFIAALALAPWRLPMVALAISLATCMAAIAGLFGLYALGGTYLLEQLPHPHLLYKAQIPWGTLSFFALLVPAVVCSRLHRSLLGSSRSGGTYVEPA